MIKRILETIVKWCQSGQMTITPLPHYGMTWTDDERRLFDLLPQDEQLAIARKYFATEGQPNLIVSIRQPQRVDFDAKEWLSRGGYFKQ